MSVAENTVWQVVNKPTDQTDDLQQNLLQFT